MSGATPGSGSTPGASSSQDAICDFCARPIVPDVMQLTPTLEIVFQPETVPTLENKISTLHVNCSNSSIYISDLKKRAAKEAKEKQMRTLPCKKGADHHHHHHHRHHHLRRKIGTPMLRSRSLLVVSELRGERLVQ